MGKDFNEMLFIELISVTGGLITGFALASFTNQLSLIPGLFILLPGFLEMRGAIGGSLASRISSGLFLGVIKPRFRKNSMVKSNIIATAALIIICSFILGIVSYLASTYFFNIINIKLVFIAIIAGVISIVITPTTIFTTIWLFRKGHDPNYIMGPYITTLGDLISVVSFIIAIAAVAWI